MSGGHYNYLFDTIQDTYQGDLHDAQLEELLVDFCELLKALEWWRSCDTSEADYMKAVEAFKTKWLKNGVLCEDCTYRVFANKVGNIIIDKMIELGIESVEELTELLGGES